MSVSLQDIVKGLDPTGFTAISGAQLAQLVDNGTPYTDKGMVIMTTDAAGVPDVPNAATTTKWKRYLWVRQTATTTKVYAWNDTAASEATFLKWIDLTNLSIATGSVTNSMLAGGITNDKLVSIEYSKVSGVPSSFTPSGAAGGDLAGTYPNPTIGAGKVLTTSLATGVGAKKVQEVFSKVTTQETTSVTTIANTDAIPQITQGAELITVNITPLALTNYLKVRFISEVSHDTANIAIAAALFYDATANAISAGRINVGAAGSAAWLEIIWYGLVSDLIGALAQITFRVRWATSSGNAYTNGINAARRYGGTMATWLTVEEFRP